MVFLSVRISLSGLHSEIDRCVSGIIVGGGINRLSFGCVVVNCVSIICVYCLC